MNVRTAKEIAEEWALHPAQYHPDKVKIARAYLGLARPSGAVQKAKTNPYDLENAPR